MGSSWSILWNLILSLVSFQPQQINDIFTNYRQICLVWVLLIAFSFPQWAEKSDKANYTRSRWHYYIHILTLSEKLGPIASCKRRQTAQKNNHSSFFDMTLNFALIRISLISCSIFYLPFTKLSFSKSSSCLFFHKYKIMYLCCIRKG